VVAISELSRHCRELLKLVIVGQTLACAPAFSRIVSDPGKPIVIPAYSVPPRTWRPNQPLSGASRVDITPPPGYPTGGHGPAGAMSRGYWTRLYARAFFFADTTGSTLTLVSAEFFAVPGALTAEVRRRVIRDAWKNHGISIQPSSIIIAATHTHQGHGNYLSAITYNQFGSRYPGFDKLLLDTLTARITSAVNAAIADALRSGKSTMTIRHGRLSEGLLLNRSAATFMNNWNADQLMNELNPQVP
jgi:neutral ceramidase